VSGGSAVAFDGYGLVRRFSICTVLSIRILRVVFPLLPVRTVAFSLYESESFISSPSSILSSRREDATATKRDTGWCERYCDSRDFFASAPGPLNSLGPAQTHQYPLLQ
jgi:hypothetical protein